MPPRRSVPAPSLEAGGGGAPSCPGCWGSGARAMGDLAFADLLSHLPPHACRAGTAEGMSARVSRGGVAGVTLPGGMWCGVVSRQSWRPGSPPEPGARRVEPQGRVPGMGCFRARSPRGGGFLSPRLDACSPTVLGTLFLKHFVFPSPTLPPPQPIPTPPKSAVPSTASHLHGNGAGAGPGVGWEGPDQTSCFPVLEWGVGGGKQERRGTAFGKEPPLSRPL